MVVISNPRRRNVAGEGILGEKLIVMQEVLGFMVGLLNVLM
jgi:hypothetical protein